MPRKKIYTDEELRERRNAASRRAYWRERGVIEGNERLAAYRAWTEEEIAFLLANLESMSNPQIAERLGRKVGQVKSQLSRLGLRRKVDDGAIERRRAERERIERWKREREENRKKVDDARREAAAKRERKSKLTAQQKAEIRAKKARAEKAMRVVAPPPPPPPPPKRLSDADYAFFKARKEMKTRPGRLTVGWR